MIPKFRAWHIEEKKMYDVRLIDFRKKEATLINNLLYKGFRARFDDIIFIQSLGLKDKNEQDIFDGDVVEIATANYNPWRVEWLQKITSFNFIQMGGRCANMNPVEKCSHLYQVIGNIYENPELLKEKV